MSGICAYNNEIAHNPKDAGVSINNHISHKMSGSIAIWSKTFYHKVAIWCFVNNL